MPILKPAIQTALREAGLTQSQRTSKNSSLEESLDQVGLTLESSLETLYEIQENGESAHVRARAAETALKMRGLLKDQAAPPPNINIVITDTKGGSLDRILLPREIEI